MTEFLIKWISKKSIGLRVLLSVICYNIILLTGLLDYNSSSINLFIFYALTIVFAAMFLSTADGIFASILCSVLNYLTNSKFLTYDSFSILIFNFVIDLCVFLLIVMLVVQIRKAFLREKNLARIDFLTGLKNRRSFVEELTEKNKIFLSEYSLCYIDVDRFYSFIETHGLIKADDMLKKISRFLLKFYKAAYRYEENRFILVFDETNQKRTAFSKMQILKNELQIELAKHHLPATLSIGILYVTQTGFKVSHILYALSNIVHEIKKEGGDRVKYAVLEPEGRK